MDDFQPFPKMARLSRDMIITEKLDGTNAQIFIDDTGTIIKVGSRTRWLTEHEDNFGFYKWAMENRDELLKLGPGRHFGEWWGKGIQRGYGKLDRTFSLFNVSRWYVPGSEPTGLLVDPTKFNPAPACCSVVPVLFSGMFNTGNIEDTFARLRITGSKAAPFGNPEGIIIYHTAANIAFKKTFEGDEKGKEANAAQRS